MNLETWFKTKHSAFLYERQLGLDEWSDTERSVLAFIAGSNGTTLEKIIGHEFFLNTSRSTLKRAVAFLKLNDIITTTNNPNDRREMLLTYNTEK